MAFAMPGQLLELVNQPQSDANWRHCAAVPIAVAHWEFRLAETLQNIVH